MKQLFRYNPPLLCLHKWILPLEVIICLTFFTLSPAWAALTSQIPCDYTLDSIVSVLYVLLTWDSLLGLNLHSKPKCNSE